MIELSTAAIKVAIRHAARIRVRRTEGPCASSVDAVLGRKPSSGKGRPRYVLDAERFCHPCWEEATCPIARLPCYLGETRKQGFVGEEQGGLLMAQRRRAGS